MDRNKIECFPQLVGFAANKYSQFGCDGLVEKIFSIIGTKNQCMAEIGAADGIFMSNSRYLLEQGWAAWLIEKDEDAFHKLHNNSQKFNKAKPIHAEINTFNINNILKEHNLPFELDLITIDIDGQDYWVWNSLIDFTPRVLMIEYSQVDADYLPDHNMPGQAGINPIIQLGASKGYSIAARTYCNAIFIKNEIGVEFFNGTN